MSVTITRLFDDDTAARRAIRALKAADSGRDDGAAARKSMSLGDVAAAIGGVLVVLVGLILMVIPGLGAIVMGLIVGWLIQRAMADKTVKVRSEPARQGGVLVTARVPDAERARLESVLDRSAVNRTDPKSASRPRPEPHPKPAYRKAS